MSASALARYARSLRTPSPGTGPRDGIGEGEMRTLAEAEAEAEGRYESTWDPEDE